MAQYALNINMLADLTSFFSVDRFSYSTESGFRVAIPRVNGWDYCARAKIQDLKAYLLSDVNLARCGHISKHKPLRPIEEGYR
jgi:hypothetical protein